MTARISAEKASGGYADKAQVSESAYTTNAYGSMAIDFVFDVESLSGDHVRITIYGGDADRKLLGSSTLNRTGITFIRLGDT